jgi:hypothetical protein
MTAEELRKVSGGVIGHFTPKERQIDVKENLENYKVGNNLIGLKIPAGKFLVGAYISNAKDDLAGGTVGVNVGETVIIEAQDISGTGKAELLAQPEFIAEATDVELAVATGNLTAGNLNVGVIYM